MIRRQDRESAEVLCSARLRTTWGRAMLLKVDPVTE